MRRVLSNLAGNMPKRVMVGEVEKVINNDTVSVVVTKVKSHPLYKKVIRIRKKYIAHVFENNGITTGANVEIEESRPLSKLKKWVVKTVK